MLLILKPNPQLKMQVESKVMLTPIYQIWKLIRLNTKQRCVRTGLKLEFVDMETNANLLMEIRNFLRRPYPQMQSINLRYVQHSKKVYSAHMVNVAYSGMKIEHLMK